MKCGESCNILQMSEPDTGFLLIALCHFPSEVKCPHTNDNFNKAKNFLLQYKKEIIEWKANESKLSEEIIAKFQNAMNIKQIYLALIHAKEFYHCKIPMEDVIFRIYQKGCLNVFAV